MNGSGRLYRFTNERGSWCCDQHRVSIAVWPTRDGGTVTISHGPGSVSVWQEERPRLAAALAHARRCWRFDGRGTSHDLLCGEQ